jgi:hypothetical protein
MAWVTVPKSNNIWEYDTAGVSGYTDAPGIVASGIRTFSFAGGNSQLTYVSVRKTGETVIRDELSKDYYDAKP